MGVLKNLLNSIEDLENKIKILETQLNKLNQRIDVLNSVEKIPEGNKHTATNPYIFGSSGAGGIDSISVEESEDNISNLLTNEVTLSEDGTEITFKTRPPYAVYYPG